MFTRAWSSEGLLVPITNLWKTSNDLYVRSTVSQSRERNEDQVRTEKNIEKKNKNKEVTLLFCTLNLMELNALNY